MFGDMMDKLQGMQQQVEEIKKRLETITVQGEAEGIIVKINGNRKIQDITIPQSLMDDQEALEDLLVIATNRAIEVASNLNDTEMASSAKGILPNFPGFG